MNSLRSAAHLAEIEVVRIINEPYAAALAYGVGKKLLDKNDKSLNNKQNLDNDKPSLKHFNTSLEYVIVFDLGRSTLNITLLKIKKNMEGNIDFDILSTGEYKHLGGNDFDNKLIDFCFSEFCNTTGHKKENIKKDKNACERLKSQCENAKKKLNNMKETWIELEYFHGKDDLIIKISRETFEKICFDLFLKIEKIIHSVIDEGGINLDNIDEVILVGGASKMISIKTFLGKYFNQINFLESHKKNKNI